MTLNGGVNGGDGEGWSADIGQDTAEGSQAATSFYQSAGFFDQLGPVGSRHYSGTSTSELFLEQHLAKLRSLPALASGPGISIVLPTFNRAHVITHAVNSVLAQSYEKWELLIVDDGSSDDTALKIAPYLKDPRIRYFARPHEGVGATRNFALGQARQPIVAYLDSDNSYTPDYLREVARAFQRDPTLCWLYAAQWVTNLSGRKAFLRFHPFDLRLLRHTNYVDLNVLAHKREATQASGTFDPAFSRMGDWDFAYRLAQVAAPFALPVIGSLYNADSQDSITRNEAPKRNLFLFRRKHRARLKRPLRVLYAVRHCPQLSESHVRWEIECLRAWGVEVSLWWSSQEPTTAPFLVDPPILKGDLAQVIDQVRPDIVHCHWLSFARSIAAQVRAANLPLTVRDHAFDTPKKLVRWAQLDRVVQGVYIFPTLRQQFWPRWKLRPTPSSFNPDLYYPAASKDRRLVLRLGAAIPKTKELELFFQVAKRCPSHRFAIALVVAHELQEHAKILIELNEAMGRPVDIRLNLDSAEVAQLTRQAGILLHTKAANVNYGMPVSIAESMATGTYVLTRDCPAARNYLGGAGATYRNEDEALAKIHATLTWSDEDWRLAQKKAIERAFRRHADVLVFWPMLRDWLRLAGRGDEAQALRVTAPSLWRR